MSTLNRKRSTSPTIANLIFTDPHLVQQLGIKNQERKREHLSSPSSPTISALNRRIQSDDTAPAFARLTILPLGSFKTSSAVRTSTKLLENRPKRPQRPDLASDRPWLLPRGLQDAGTPGDGRHGGPGHGHVMAGLSVSCVGAGGLVGEV